MFLRQFQSQLRTTWLWATTLLIVLFSVAQSAKVLTMAATGKVEMAAALLYLALRLPELLHLAVPLACALAIFWTVSRLWQSGEMLAALFAGVPLWRLWVVVMLWAIILGLAQAVLSFWLVPQASCYATSVWKTSRAQVAIQNIEPYAVHTLGNSGWQVSATARRQQVLAHPMLLWTTPDSAPVRAHEWVLVTADTMQLRPCPRALAWCGVEMRAVEAAVRAGDGSEMRISVDRLLFDAEDASLATGGTQACHPPAPAHRWFAGLSALLAPLVLALGLWPLAMRRRTSGLAAPLAMLLALTLLYQGSLAWLIEWRGLLAQPWQLWLAAVHAGALAAMLLCARLWQGRYGVATPLLPWRL